MQAAPAPAEPTAPEPPRLAEPPSVWALFAIFTRIGLTSFGGGLSGWLLREFVRNRPWISEEDFFNGLSLSQALPGVNVVNMAIWIGFRLRGWRGVLAGIAGIVLPAAVVVVLLGMVFALLSRFPATQWGLDGAAGAAIGLSLSMGLAAARRLPRRVIPFAFAAGTFCAVGLLHFPLLRVVVIGGSASVALEYVRLVTGEPA